MLKRKVSCKRHESLHLLILKGGNVMLIRNVFLPSASFFIHVTVLLALFNVQKNQ